MECTGTLICNEDTGKLQIAVEGERFSVDGLLDDFIGCEVTIKCSDDL